MNNGTSNATTTTPSTLSTATSTPTTTSSLSPVTSQNTSGLSGSQIGGIVGGVVAAFLIAVVILAAVFWRRRRQAPAELRADSEHTEQSGYQRVEEPEQPDRTSDIPMLAGVEKKELDGQAVHRPEVRIENTFAELPGSVQLAELPAGAVKR
ncbi:hypothetical protein AWENTII_008936 [Aspergillus wentii]